MKWLLLVVLCVAADFAAAELPENGMPFLAARRLLLAQRWLPDGSHRATADPYFGVEKELRRRRFKELESCAMDRPYYIFHYRKADRCLRLVTEGERVQDMKVQQLRIGCKAPD